MDPMTLAPSDITTRLILWDTDPDTLPELTRPQWQRWAARSYRTARARALTSPLPLAPGSEFNRAFHRAASEYVDSLCAALAVRAADLGWDDLAEQWRARASSAALAAPDVEGLLGLELLARVGGACGKS